MINQNSGTWLAISRYVKQEIEDKRLQLESPLCPDGIAHQLRGTILAYREILSLAEQNTQEAE